jgi:hypothetical protein
MRPYSANQLREKIRSLLVLLKKHSPGESCLNQARQSSNAETT